MEFESLSIHRTIDNAAQKRGRFSPEAYFFTLEALNRTVRHMPVRRHLSGPELLRGIVFAAYERFGDMAANVLDEWGVSRTGDFGQIVFDLIEVGILSKTEDDRLEDFEEIFDLQDEIVEEGWRQKWRVGGSEKLMNAGEDLRSD